MATRLYYEAHRYTVLIDKPHALDGDDLKEVVDIAMERMDETVDEDGFCGGCLIGHGWQSSEPAEIEFIWDDPFPVETILQCIDEAIDIMVQTKE